MPILRSVDIVGRLRCPRCRSPLTDDDSACTSPSCDLSARRFRRVAEQAVLIDADDSIVDPSAVTVPSEKSERAISRLIGRLSPANPVAPRISRTLAADAAAVDRSRRPVVLVIGGGTIGSGLTGFYADPSVDILAFDVYPSRYTQFVADGQAIPLADESVDGVIVQAVLEHVLEPARVVAEIHRVLRPAGVVYADTPFLQHVHEGPFDFTRFTESGHRWLFRRFALLESGVVAGVGTELAWSVAHAARSVIPLRGVTSAVRLAMTPAAMLLDRLVDPAYAIDGASSVYFYGRRSTQAIRPRDMIDHYRGAQAVPMRAT
jgi:SAM-dependent methyltransferase